MSPPSDHADCGCGSDGEEDTFRRMEEYTEVTNSPKEVTIYANVDVEEADREQLQMFREMATIFETGFETFVEKQLDYGDAITAGGEAESRRDSGPFVSARQANLYKTYTRQQDKAERLHEQLFGSGSDRVGEGADDTALDGMVYWAIMVWLLAYYRPQNDDDPFGGCGAASAVTVDGDESGGVGY